MKKFSKNLFRNFLTEKVKLFLNIKIKGFSNKILNFKSCGTFHSTERKGTIFFSIILPFFLLIPVKMSQNISIYIQ